MAFHERWFQASKQQRFAQALALVPDGPGELVEVGSWEGRSTIQLARTFPSNAVHAIDHWKGDITNPRSPVAAIAARRDVYADFLTNLREAGVANRVTIHRADWREVFATWTAPIRLCFIDGQHTYEEVADNIRAARPLLVPGGVICGDDFTVPQVARAVRDTLGLGNVDTTHGPGAAIWWWPRPPLGRPTRKEQRDG